MVCSTGSAPSTSRSPVTRTETDYRRRRAALLAAAEAAVEAEPAPVALSAAERRSIVDTLRSLLEGLYVHLAQKRASYAFDPLQRLRLLGERVADDAISDGVFHREMAQIFTDLRDAHTRYLGPRRHADHARFLPIMVERFVDPDDTSGYLASKVAGLTPAEKARFTRAGFENGVELTHWNGVKIARALELYAERETGGRPDARIARALESLTIRPLRYALPPDEDWVDIRFLTKRGAERELRLEWRQVIVSPTEPSAGSARGELAYDPVADAAREIKKMLFAGKVWLREKEALAGSRRPTVREAIDDGWTSDGDEWLSGQFGAAMVAKVVRHRRRVYGYLRIYSFQVADDQAFIAEAAELLAQLPSAGLIVDLRSNPGGLIWAAEGLLQLLTPNTIEPTRFSMAATDMSRAVVHAPQNRRLAPWAESLDEAVATGANRSRGVPLTPVDRCNNRGQSYGGPVIALVDANTYSAGDLFAAGFVDNDVGRLICTDLATGGGGANVWLPSDVDRALVGTGYELPSLGPVSYTLSVRRAERVGESGADIEDTGVTSSFRRNLTRRDLVDNNRDLLDYACGLLATEVVTSMQVEVVDDTVSVTAERLSSAQLVRDGVALLSVEIDASGRATIPLPDEWTRHRIELLGYDGAVLRQRRSIA